MNMKNMLPATLASTALMMPAISHAEQTKRTSTVKSTAIGAAAGAVVGGMVGKNKKRRVNRRSSRRFGRCGVFLSPQPRSRCHRLQRQRLLQRPRPQQLL
ncbi:hypothetical protein EGK75_00140 [Neisseria weixii]|uniref:Uncharacterized protein n=1 Tax=Neisseria weixii TaxID=1853276 RepID=A0A3N4NUF3_9NEIS|nr:hypothetical protein EGK74_00140 [Neisseria weixii]RPD90996.1 hypothetical protein EGK75_00140 [Neisseria weixii]